MQQPLGAVPHGPFHGIVRFHGIFIVPHANVMYRRAAAAYAMMAHEMRILILSASVGAGHVRAAEAVEAALERIGAPVTIAHYDVLALMPPAFRRVYRDGYFKWWRARPASWVGSTTPPTSRFTRTAC